MVTKTELPSRRKNTQAHNPANLSMVSENLILRTLPQHCSEPGQRYLLTAW
jgi:hypothetical protein